MSEKDNLEPWKPCDKCFTSPLEMRTRPPATTMKIAINFAPVKRFCVPVAKLTL